MICRVNVTQELIDMGERFEPERCPIAYGIKAAGLPEVDHVSVGPLSAYVYFKDGTSAYAKLPFEALVLRRDFDRGEPVLPTAFELVLE